MGVDAILIRRLPWREYDQRLIFYGRQIGRFNGVAKGSLRSTSRQGHAFDEGNLIRCQLVEGQSGMLVTSAQTQRCWHRVKHDPLRWAVAQSLLQAVDATVFDHEPDEGVWEALRTGLEALEEGHEPLEVLRVHQALLLNALGYGMRPVKGVGPYRSPLDDAFDQIAHRQLRAVELAYRLALRARS